jgi:pimeloyl-ACP methyl ester carboxylesterase
MKSILLTGCVLLLLTGCPRKPVERNTGPVMGPSVPAFRPKFESRKQKVVKLLSGKTMPTEQQVRSLGTGVDSDLVDVVNSRATEQLLRLRAVYCMGYFQNRRARMLLRSVLTDPNWDKPFRLAALEATARSVGSDAYETVKQYTLDPDDDMRLAAIKALVIIGTPDVLPLLRTLQLRESDPRVLDAIDDAIRKVGHSPLEGM